MKTPWQHLRTLDAAWTHFLSARGASIERTDACFVAWLGETCTLLVAHDKDLDADDTLAQIILHELCHHLVEGTQSWQEDDWGLNNQTDDHLYREYAALRLQAAILARPLLRQYLQPTTDHRWFYEALREDPLNDAIEGGAAHQSISAAKQGWANWEQWSHRDELQALLDTSEALLSSLARAR